LGDFMIFDINLINKLVSLSQSAFDFGEIPVSAAVLDHDGNIVSISSNTRQFDFSVLNHAEISAILAAEKSIGDWRLNGYYLISTLEPCDMCSAIIKESRLDKVFYLLSRSGKYSYGDNLIVKNQIVGFDIQKEILQNLLTTFFENRR
jgi:tRNA(adenine34) deaminase